MQDALKGVVRKVLTDAAQDGLPGDHHFYISFRTEHPGVRMSERLREKYPQEMTIVLQHQFWDLGVTEHAFEVGLSFSGVPERLLVPFDALTGFFDPSVQFGLKFEVQSEEAEAEPTPPPRRSRPARGAGSEPVELQPKKPAVPRRRARGRRQAQAPKRRQEPNPRRRRSRAARGRQAGKDRRRTTPAASAEVVSLDAFRKKS